MKFYISVIALSLGLLSAQGDELDNALTSERDSQTATAISIIFDSSGSMRDDKKIEQAQSAFTSWLASLPDTYTLGLVYFSRGVAQLAVPLGEDNKEAISRQVASVKAYGKTPIADCLRVVRAQIEKRRAEFSPYERHVVVVFTDGAETVDPGGNRAVLSEVIKLRSLIVEVVGIGFKGQGDYLAVATTQYFDANDEQELVAGLSQVDAEIGDSSDLEISEKDLAVIRETIIATPPAPIRESE
ncbi:MAG: VWA domain-containing protein [Verrucomicrobiales bacterium]|nr:VWA domain-containing protein [Verrucomicrobiales bacterium]